MPTIASPEFGQRLREKLNGRRKPLGGGWELTLRCNLKCDHCYAIYDTPKDLLSFEDIKRIADEMANEGTLGLFLTGGEIMTRRDFPDIYLYLKRSGFLLTLFTNATNLSDEIEKLLKEYPPFRMEISIYGATKETYEKVTRIPGSFDRFSDGLERVRRSGFQYLIKTALTKTNVHEAQAMRAKADELGVRFRWDGSITPRMTGDLTPCSLRLSPEELVTIEEKDTKRAEAWLDHFNKFRKVYSEAREELFSCGAGLTSFFISAQGKLYPCLMVREDDAYDLRKGNFHDGFMDHLGGFRERKKEHTKRCDSCQIKSLCDGCPGYSLWEEGHLEAPVDYVCDISHLRYERFIEPHLPKGEEAKLQRRVTPFVSTLPVYGGAK